MWHEIDGIETSDSGEIATRVSVPPESSWFSGHFPDDPILPGIAQLGFVYETVRRIAGPEYCLAGVSRVKFKKMVRPHDDLKISIAPKKDQVKAYAFRIIMGNDLVCSGNLKLEKRDRFLDTDDEIRDHTGVRSDDN